MTKEKKIFITTGIAACLILIAFLLLYYRNSPDEKVQENYENYLEKHYIFDKNFQTGKKISAKSVNKYFHNGVVTARALDLFRFLEKEFAVKSLRELDDHFNQVEQYLNSHFEESEAKKLNELYQKHLRCQIELVNNPKYGAKTADPRHLLVLLNSVQNFRREKMGKENADTLFGGEVKEREYSLRRAIIIDDDMLYGKEKEASLQKLKSDMWDGEVSPMVEDSNPYDRYQFKMQLYQKDLSELGEKERKLRIDEFRREFFTKEEIKRLAAVDKQITQEKENMERYRLAESNILNLRDITPEEKAKRIKLLQDKFFGKEAEAFRRREAMRKALEK